MMRWLAALAMVSCFAFFACPSLRAQTVLAHTTFFNALSVTLVTRHMMRRPVSRTVDGFIVLGSLVCLLLGNVLFVAPLPHGAAIRGLVGFPFYTGFYVGLCVLLVRHLSRAKLLMRPWVLGTMAVGSLGLSMLQAATLLEPMRATAAMPVIVFYLVAKSVAMMAVIVGSLLIMTQPEHLFLQAVLAMSVSGYAKAYDAFYSQQTSTCWAQAVWFIGCAALALTLMQGTREARLLWAQPASFGAASSVRTLLGVTVFGAMNLVILVWVSLGIGELRDPFILTTLGLTIFVAWLLANMVSLRWSLALRGTRALMPDVVSAPEGGPVALPLIERRSPLGEINEVIDGYNQAVQRGNQLLGRSHDAALVRQAVEVAHDIRGPLAALRVASHEISDANAELRQLMNDAVQRIHHIATGLLCTRREADARANTELASLADTVVCEQRLRYREYPHIKLSHTVDASARGVRVHVSHSDLRRALSNIMTNAVEAIEHVGVVQVRVHVDGQQAGITVIDDGPGMPPEMLGKLGIEGFTHGKVDGNGLGLSMVRRTMAQCGGSISFSSTQGAGTKVVLLLPVAAQNF